MLRAVMLLGDSPLTTGEIHTRCAWNPGGFFKGPVLTLTGSVYSRDDCNKTIHYSLLHDY